ncbi:Retrotransposon-derived protein PEG10 [Anabarilius grahami]|uniref:Retrotransposon-derived protein PEG10 n=1 Tax=Anabarilius grahami TaxID=495550 RepID=A0A3N0YPL4_ANAGA|nr:Retrotransposon-derived protein PEG10 [Anabarilius grahami]
MQPHLYPNDTSKIAFLISQLNGKALKWADSIWSQHGAITQSYSAFISHFREVFGKPLTDSSAGEKLYNLKQGAMSIYDYALQFRTLAAVCGWNEQALITTYRQGLEPRVRLQLAACEDTIGLEKFIQHSIRCATRMQACLQEHQDQFLPISSLCRSEPVSSPEPANDPMDVENSRLTPSERQRRLTLHLCLYCGAPGHIISACPIRPPRPMVSAIIPSLKKMKPLSTVVNLTAADVSIAVVALLDSGSAGNFISCALCRQLRLKTSPSPTVYQINSITGRPLSRKQVRRIGGPLKLQVGLLHHEDIHLLVLEDSTADVVLGRPWLEQHNPTISWNTGEILKWGETCFSGCISDLPVPPLPPSELSLGATSIESPGKNATAPPEVVVNSAAPPDAAGPVPLPSRHKQRKRKKASFASQSLVVHELPAFSDMATEAIPKCLALLAPPLLPVKPALPKLPAPPWPSARTPELPEPAWTGSPVPVHFLMAGIHQADSRPSGSFCSSAD